MQRGHTLDGLGTYYRETIVESDQKPVDVAQILRDTNADVLVCYLPVGSEQAARHYAQAAIDAGVGYVNCLPVFIASEVEWAKKFGDAGLPIIGDDIKSQVGATITPPRPHEALRGPRCEAEPDLPAQLRRQHGLHEHAGARAPDVEEDLEDTVGSVTAPSRARQERTSTSDRRTTCRGSRTASGRRSAWRAESFGDVPLIIEMKLEVWDSPNSAGIVIDAVRCVKLALDRGIAGPLIGPSAYFMKSPPVQFSDDAAREMVEEFIQGNGASAAADWTAFFDVRA